MAFSHHVPRFSFTNTDISELDIEWLLENNVPLSQLLPAADDYSSPPSPIDGAFDDLPELSPDTTSSSLPYFNSSPVSESPETPRASRSSAIPRSQKPDIPLALAGYTFSPSSPSTPSRSATPTPADPLDTTSSLLPKFLHAPSNPKHASTILVELDEFFPRRPSDTFSPFPTFSSMTSAPSSISDASSMTPSDPPRKGSLASSLFSTTSSGSSRSSTSDDAASSTTRFRTRTRSRTLSNKSDQATSTGGGGGGGDLEVRQPKLAAYPRYVPPKVPPPPKPEGEGGTGGRKLRLFGR